MRVHNDSINVKLYEAISEYVTKIPTFPNSLKIKKSDEEELEANFDNLNLDDDSDDEEFKPKKTKKTKKNELVESSEEDEEYITVKGKQSKRKSLRNKITP